MQESAMAHATTQTPLALRYWSMASDLPTFNFCDFNFWDTFKDKSLFKTTNTPKEIKQVSHKYVTEQKMCVLISYNILF